jgi:hypothetical protein
MDEIGQSHMDETPHRAITPGLDRSRGAQRDEHNRARPPPRQNAAEQRIRKARALDAQRPGTYTAALVDYKHGDRAAAQAVAHDLRVIRVQTMNANLSALAGSATIAVVAGDTQANPQASE